MAARCQKPAHVGKPALAHRGGEFRVGAERQQVGNAPALGQLRLVLPDQLQPCLVAEAFGVRRWRVLGVQVVEAIVLGGCDLCGPSFCLKPTDTLADGLDCRIGVKVLLLLR
jgi:hypothetical protein